MAKDIFHDNVKQALINDNWKITDDPYRITHLKKTLQVDLGAEKLIGAEKDNFKIAVEIKSFLSHSRLHDYQKALGQYRTYKRIMAKKESTRTLFLAVPKDAYDEFFTTPFGQEAIEEEDLNLLVYNPLTNTIEAWIN